MAMEACIALTLYMQNENWSFAVYDALTQERKEKLINDNLAKIEEWDAEKMAEKEGEMKEDKSDDEVLEEGAKGENAEEADEADQTDEVAAEKADVAEETE